MFLDIPDFERLQQQRAKVGPFIRELAGKMGITPVPSHRIKPSFRNTNAYVDLLRRRIHIGEGLVGKLYDNELKAVIAHEMAHIQRGDIYPGLLKFLCNLSALMSFVMLFMFLVFTGTFIWPLLAVYGGAKLFNLLLLTRSRHGEFDCDRRAAIAIGDPMAVADALRKTILDDPRAIKGGTSIFRTHPCPRERIRRLERMANPNIFHPRTPC